MPARSRRYTAAERASSWTGGSYVEPPAAGERVVALQLILVGDEAELHLGGRRIVLGRVQP